MIDLAQLLIFFTPLVLLIIAYFAYKAGQEHGEMVNRIRQLEKQIEENQPRAHTHSTIACLEDATAVAIDLMEELKITEARVETLHMILGQGRQSPHSYDPNRPAGLRKERK